MKTSGADTPPSAGGSYGSGTSRWAALGMMNVIYGIAPWPSAGIALGATAASIALLVGGAAMPARLLSLRLATGISPTLFYSRGVIDGCRGLHPFGRPVMKIGLLAMSGIRAHDKKTPRARG